MLICLQGMNIITIPVGLFIFDHLDKRSKTSVHQWQLPAGGQGQMHCSNIIYDVQYGGYYCFAYQLDCLFFDDLQKRNSFIEEAS